MPSIRLTGLWRHPDFLRLWVSQSVSLLGGQITALAVPLTAILLLGAGPEETGLLTAAGYAPMLLFGLAAGAWVDRWPRRRILIASDLGRAMLVASIPAAAMLGALHLEQLYAVAFASGTLAVFSSLAATAFLPGLVGRAHVVEANGKLESSAAAARMIGPVVGGGLVQAIGAPLAVLADALSFVISAVVVRGLRDPQPGHAGTPRRSVWSDIREGFRWVRSNRIVLSLMTGAAIINWAYAAVQALFILYATRDLALSPVILGLVLAVSGPASLAGAALAGRLSARFGIGPTIMGAVLLEGFGRALLTVAGGVPALAALVLMVARAADGFAGPAFNVNSVSLRQAITPENLHGRVNATARVIALSTAPLGAVMAGWLGDLIGLRAALAITVPVTLAGFLVLFLSPLRRLRGLPRV